MRFGVFQLLCRVEMLAFIALVFFKRPKRPRLRPLKPVVIRVEFHEVDGQLAPDDELLKECFAVGRGAPEFFTASATVWGPMWPK